MSTRDVFYILPDHISKVIEDVKNLERVNEIRLRSNKPIAIYIDENEKILNYIIKPNDLSKIIQRMSNYSMYAFDEELKQGYITIKGGHRVGICGSCVINKGEVKTIKNISSLNIRISRQIINCSKKLLPYLMKNSNLMNTIIISPPKCGKTTLIRDISRNLSNGFTLNNTKIRGMKVCIIDERSEIGGCYNGTPQLDVGNRTDIMDNCMKSSGIMMAIRSMSPDVIICDEIGTYDDIKSIIAALSSGIKLITTIHGFGIEDLNNRDVFREIIKNKVFKRAVILSNRNKVGTIEYIYDFTKKMKIGGNVNDN
ncbi:stage III sporulation protein AA [Clostridium sediminicola]|uniref:stage III sporulation protein AA n=1 Tax=Clostridium sediminicola TaxID=3114879 RepID=UPI0031F1F75D